MLTGWLLVGRNPFGTNPFGAGLKGCCDLRFELVLPGFGVVGCGEFTFFLLMPYISNRGDHGEDVLECFPICFGEC